MPHSYSNLLTHIVYSTKKRRPLIESDLELRLFPYFGGTVRQLGGTLYTVNGVEDHVHLIAHLPPTIAVAEAIGKIKGSSTHWIHESFPDRSEFSWQRDMAHSASASRMWQSRSIHRTAEGTSQEAIVSGGVRRASTTTRHFDRRKIPLDVTCRICRPLKRARKF